MANGAEPSDDLAPLIAPGATLKELGATFEFTEGPAADRDGNVFFTDQPNDRIVRWDAKTGALDDWMKPAGRANGTYFDRDGNLLACADEKNQLWSIAPDKSVTVLLEKHEGNLLNGPNDLWIHPSGSLYFTDPLYARPYWQRDKTSQQRGQNVYLLAKNAKSATQVVTDLRQPNGIVGTPDGTKLYVADIGAKKTYVYRIDQDGTLQEKQLFCELGSDGMTLDEQGNLYLTGDGVIVFDSSGKKLGQVKVPQRWTANVTFGGVDHKTLFITASKGVYGLDMAVRGGAPPRSP